MKVTYIINVFKGGLLQTISYTGHYIEAVNSIKISKGFEYQKRG